MEMSRAAPVFTDRVSNSEQSRKLLMRTLQALHANRLAVLLGAALVCALGSVAGCNDESTTATLNPEANKAREQAEGDARRAAYGKLGTPEKAGKAKPKS